VAGAGTSESGRPSAEEQEISDLMKGMTLRSAKGIPCPKSGQWLADSEATFQVNSGELLDKLAEAAKGQKDSAVFCSLNYSSTTLLDTTCLTKLRSAWSLRYQMAKPRAFADPVVLQLGKHCAATPTATPTSNSGSGK